MSKVASFVFGMIETGVVVAVVVVVVETHCCSFEEEH